jgi:hypothetical protein
MPYFRVRIGIPIALVAAGMVAAGAVAVGHDEAVDPHPPDHIAGGPVGAVPPDVRHAFGTFRAGRIAQDDLGSASRGLSDTFLVHEDGLAIAEARSAAAPAGARAWVAPSEKGLCLLILPKGAVGVGGACSTYAEAVDGTMVVTSSAERDSVEVYGVVPDGVPSVELVLDDGSTRTIRVERNTYGASADQPTAAIEFDGADGPHRVDAHSFRG